MKIQSKQLSLCIIYFFNEMFSFDVSYVSYGIMKTYNNQ